ncbi:hypothetical protein GRJ2_000330200 [Grus japonensis]|uniref:Uncharacterized protein n=1 Tax=Grus japonensis TaxID=30415 RepID=A0ABC9VZ47_GRUJA
MKRVWAKKRQVLAHGQTCSLLLLRIPGKRNQRIIVRQKLLLPHATPIQRLDPFPALRRQTLRGSLRSTHEACAKVPEDTQQENIVRKDYHTKKDTGIFQPIVFTYSSKTIQMKTDLEKNYQDGISVRKARPPPRLTSCLDNGLHSKPNSAPSGTDFN